MWSGPGYRHARLGRACLPHRHIWGRPAVDASAFSGSADLIGGQGADGSHRGARRRLAQGRGRRRRATGRPGPGRLRRRRRRRPDHQRDELTEPVDCGDGADTALADAFDGLTAASRSTAATARGAAGRPGELGGTGTPGVDGVAPALSGLALSRRGVQGRSTGARASRGCGTGLRFTLSERATARPQDRARCTRASRRRPLPGAERPQPLAPGLHALCPVRGRSHAGAEGANSLAFRGCPAAERCVPGRYRLVRAPQTLRERSEVRARQLPFRPVRNSPRTDRGRAPPGNRAAGRGHGSHSSQRRAHATSRPGPGNAVIVSLVATVPAQSASRSTHTA